LAPALAGRGGLPSRARPPRRAQGDPREPRRDRRGPRRDAEGREPRGDLLPRHRRRVVSGALARLTIWSLKTRIVARLRRLRQIRYLMATIVGAAYVVFVWRPYRAAEAFGRLRDSGGGVPADFFAAVEPVMGGIIVAIALLRWLWPGGS